MNVKELTLTMPDYPCKLRRIADPPAQLFVWGSDINDLFAHPCVTIVGSRKVSNYGKTVTAQLAGDLAKAGVVVISGLAYGVDSIAHRAALDAGGLTAAVLPTSLNVIYPAGHRDLARQMVAQGGAVVTEYNTNNVTHKLNFIARNRITAGLCDVLLITEAAEKSGTLHTARFALEQGKEVFAVPGNITSPTSAGTNNLIKSGAGVVTGVADVLRALGIEPQKEKPAPKSANPDEQLLLTLLFEGVSDGAQLLAQSQLNIRQFTQTLTMLEIGGRIRPLGSNHWALT